MYVIPHHSACNIGAAGFDGRVTFSVLEMNDMSRFEPHSIDLVTVSFGLMYIYTGLVDIP
jgi:hypothetical protein